MFNWYIHTSDDGFDYDTDGQCDAGDADDDNDGALDEVDQMIIMNLHCNDDDGDTCDECSSGSYNLDDDGFDYDGVQCDAGDPDDDNDNALDEVDSDDNNEFICSDDDM